MRIIIEVLERSRTENREQSAFHWIWCCWHVNGVIKVNIIHSKILPRGSFFITLQISATQTYQKIPDFPHKWWSHFLNAIVLLVDNGLMAWWNGISIKCTKNSALACNFTWLDDTNVANLCLLSHTHWHIFVICTISTNKRQPKTPYSCRRIGCYRRNGGYADNFIADFMWR